MTNPFLSLAVLDTNLDFSGAKNPNPYCAQMRSKGSRGHICPTALRCPKKSSRCSLARFFRPLRVLRLAASATGGARLRTPYPSPVAVEGPSGQIAACSNFRLGSVTLCGTTTRQNIVPHPRTATPSPPNLNNKSQLQFPSKIRYLCDLRPISSHNVNFPLKVVKY